jgi:hypothetical protein
MRADTANWDIKAIYAPGWENAGIDDVDPQVEPETWAPGNAAGNGILECLSRDASN